MKKFNLSTILAVAGAVGVFAPDLASVAAWLASLGVSWLGPVAKIVGYAAGVAACLPRIVPRMRQVLATADLATAPGAVAPVPVAAARAGDRVSVGGLRSMPGSR
jgi:hypothetical protein